MRQLARASLGGARAAAADDALAGQLLAFAFPDRIAQRRAGGEAARANRYLLANGRGAMLAQASTLSGSAYLVAVELDDAEGSEARIQLAAPLDAAQLEMALGSQMVEGIETDVDPKTGSLRARRVRRLDALVIGERRVEVDAEVAARWLLESVRAEGLSALPWGPASSTLLARLRMVESQHLREAADWPAVDEATLLAQLDQWLLPSLHGMTRLNQIGDHRLAEVLGTRLTHAQRRRLDEWTPTHVTVPTGTRVPIDYLDGSAPCIEVRLQEVFGLADTPRLVAGRVPVTLKLLSPARRPVQITQDLAGFWRGSYAEVRKDMRGRYPRHHWPENPLEAEPSRGLPRRRS